MTTTRRAERSSWRVVVTGPARADVRAILRWSRRQFGDAQARRYRAAVETAVRRLESGPTAPGTRSAWPGSDPIRTMRLAGRSRHVLVFLADQQRTIFVVGVLHDAMDLPRHVPSPPGSDA